MFVAIVVGVVLLVVLIRPKWGAHLTWFLLFTYPHGWWFYHNILPLNIGFDDLFFLYLFVVVFFRRNLFGGVPIRRGYAFWVLVGFTIVAIVANLAGMLSSTGLIQRSEYIRAALKNIPVFSMFYAILHCIDNRRDLANHLVMLIVAGVIGAFLIVLQYHFPYQLEVFAHPKAYARGLQYAARGAGAFMNPNNAACVMACLALLTLPAVRLQSSFLMKAAVWMSTAVLVLGLIYTRSRSGFLALSLPLLGMAIVGRDKIASWSILLLGLIVLILFSGYSQLMIERMQEAYNPESGEWGYNVLGRFRTWSEYFKTATLRDYIFGQGPMGGIEKNRMEPHSAFVALITVYGLGSVLWAVLAVYHFFKRSLALRKASLPALAAIGRGCIWLLVAWGIYANTANALTPSYARYMLFLAVVLLDRAYFLSQYEYDLGVQGEAMWDEGNGLWSTQNAPAVF